MPSTHPTQHQFKGLADWIEILKVGDHVDSKGRSISFTAADLDQMVANNAALGAAPLVLGHPQHDDPAYGWAKEMKREDGSLFMKAADVLPAFEAGVVSGAYRNRSVHVFKQKDHGWRVRHVGWLGAAPPAIDGLKPLEFSAPESEGFEFEADVDAYDLSYALDSIASLLRGLRDSMIAKDGLDAANTALPDWTITSIGSTASRMRTAAAEASSSPFTQHNTGADMTLTQADLDRTAAETEARVRAELGSQFTAQAAADKAELTRLQAERQAERIGAQIAGWKAAGQLLPAEETGLAEFMAALDGSAGGEFQFTAASGAQPTKKTPAQFFAEFVASRGRLVKLGGKSAADPDNEGTALDTTNAAAIADAAREFQAAESAKGRTISIDQAVTHVTRQASAA